MKVNFSSYVSFARRPAWIAPYRARPDTFTALGLLRFEWGAVVGRLASIDALARGLSLSLSWLRCIEPRTPPVSFLLEISKKLCCKLKKISASYRYAFRFQSSLSKRFDFFSPTLLHQLTSFSLLLALLLSLFLRCSCFFTLKPTFLPHSLRCALSKVHC